MIVDWHDKKTGASGTISDHNDILDDLVWKASNPPMVCMTTLPTEVWRDLNGNIEFRMTPRRPSDAEIKAAKRRQKVEVILYDGDEYDASDPPENLKRFTHWLAGMMKKIPAACYASAKVEFGSEYDCCSAWLKITYQRPETDEEFAARKADVAARLAAWEKWEGEQRAVERAEVAALVGLTTG